VDLSRPVGNSKRRRPPAGDLGHLRVLREGGDPAILVLHSGGVEILEWHAGWAAMAACKRRIAGRRATLGRRGSARFGRSGMDGTACEGEGAAFRICSVREPVARTRKPVSGSVDEKRPTEHCQVEYGTSSFFLIVETRQMHLRCHFPSKLYIEKSCCTRPLAADKPLEDL
jgi:hypothetical protein